jgi:eukaryotic-like serine/threonine-protein kinase
MQPTEVALFLSETLGGRYRQTAYLGEGNFAGVFAAEDAQCPGRDLATKILMLGHCGSADAQREFADEITMLTRLADCDRVIDLHGHGEHTVHLKHPSVGGTIPVRTQYAVLERAAGSLADLLLLGSALGWPDRLRLYRDVVKGIHQMHLRGLVHRDLKADNALVLEKPQVAKVADLGRAHDTSQPPRFAVEQYVFGRGDLRCAPTEFLWLQGGTDPAAHAKADLYLLGALLFEVCTGVFFTSLVAPDPVGLANSNAAKPPATRATDWESSVPWLREAAGQALDQLEGALPAVLGKRTASLVRTLCDADPDKRLPAARPGSAGASTEWDLTWLLARVDGLRRAVDPAFRHAYLSRRPQPRLHGAPRR